MQCPACKHETPPGAQFCPHCGVRLSSRCPRCGAAHDEAHRFCPQCGGALGTTAAPAAESGPRAYTPKYLADRILGTRTSLEGERKQVTVLFVDVSGFTSLSEQLDPEDVHAVMRRAFELMLAEVHRYEGTVNQFLGDGIMALFGAPIAHEDHAERALLAALGIQAALARYRDDLLRQRGLRFDVRQGVNTGLVVVGSIGDDLRVDYTAVGDTTNVAARMLQAADPGAIFVSDQTYRIVRGRVVARDRGPLALKGKTDTVRAWQVLAARASRTRLEVAADRGLTAFVGRDAPFQALLDCFEKATSGEGQLVFVTGEPGVGKSRLLHEARRRLADGVTWLEGHARAATQSVPFAPLNDLLRRTFRIDDGDSEADAIAKVERGVLRLGEDLRPILPALRLLLALGSADAALAAMDPRQRRAEIFASVRRLMARASEIQPQVLVIEDIHWMDRATEEFLVAIADAVPTSRVLCVLTYRSGYTHPLGDRTYHTRIALTTLSADDTIRIAADRLGSTDLPVELRDLLVRRAEGNPFFIEEIVTSLLEAGAIRRIDDRYVLTGGGRLPVVPERIQDVIAARIDRLDDGTKRTLQTAAVIGRDFTLALLEKVTGAPDLPDQLRRLTSVEFLHEKRFFPEIEFTFKHALTHDVAYESLLLQRRRELHGAIAAAIEEAARDREVDHAAVLAYHFLRSDEPARAVVHLVRAGDQAVRVYANADAARHYVEALAQTDRRPDSDERNRQWIDLVVRLCGVSGARADYDRDLENLTAALAHAERLGDRPRQSQVLYWIGRTEYILGRVDSGIAHTERALAAADAAGDSGLAALPVNLLGRLYFATAHFKKASPVLERSLVLLERVGNRVETAMACGGLGWSLAMMGEFARGLDMANRGLQICEEIGHLPSQAACYTYRAGTRFPRGEWAPAMDDVRQSLALAERIGDHFRVYMSTGFLGGFLVMSGDESAGMAALERTFALADKLGTTLAMSVFRAYLAEAHLARDAVAEAITESRHAIALAAATSERWSEAWARRILARALCATDPPDAAAAEQELTRAMQIEEEIGAAPNLARSRLAWGRLLLAVGQAERGRTAIDTALAMFGALGMHWDLDRAVTTPAFSPHRGR